MAAQTQAQSSNPAQRPLQADGLFCAGSGLFSLLAVESLSRFLGLNSTAPIIVIDLGLLVYGLFLFAYATYREIDRRTVVTVTLLNVAWIISSVAIVALDPFRLTQEGKWAVFIIADIVGLFALWQYSAIRQMKA